LSSVYVEVLKFVAELLLKLLDVFRPAVGLKGT
jgi:hypothetical protein